MDTRTAPFTRMSNATVHRADRAMLDSLERGDAAGERVLARLQRALGLGPVGVTPCHAVASPEPLRSS